MAARPRPSLYRALLAGLAIAMLLPLLTPLPVTARQDSGDIVQPRGDPALSGVMPGTGPDAWETGWQYDMEGGISMGLGLAGATLYLVTKSPGALVAINTADGTPTWTYEPGGDTVFGPAVTDELVYLSAWSEDGSAVVAVDPASGEEAWRVDVAGAPTAPAATGEAVYVALTSTLDADSGVLALDPASGDELWSHDLPESFSLGDMVAVAGDLVITSGYTGSGSTGAAIYALDAATGEERWRFTGSNSLTFDPAVGSGVVVAMELPAIWGLDLETGEKLWQVSGPSSGGGAAVTDDLVVLGLRDEVRALDARTGEEAWSAPISGIGGPPVVAGDVAYVAAWQPSDQLDPHMLYAFDLASGEEAWSQELEFSVSGNQPLAHGGVLYLDGNGVLVAVGAASGGQEESTPGVPAIAGGAYESDSFPLDVAWDWPWQLDEVASQAEDDSDTVVLDAGTASVFLIGSTLDLDPADALATMVDLRRQSTDDVEVLGEGAAGDAVAVTLGYEVGGEATIEHLEIRPLDGGGLLALRFTAPADAAEALFASAQAAIRLNDEAPFVTSLALGD